MAGELFVLMRGANRPCRSCIFAAGHNSLFDCMLFRAKIWPALMHGAMGSCGCVLVVDLFCCVA